MRFSNLLGVFLLLFVLLGAGSSAETIKLEVVKDVWLSSYVKKSPETDFSMGATSKIKLKGFEEFGLFDFDTSILLGKKILSAALYLKPAGGAVIGLNSGSDLRWISISSVSHGWEEGKQSKAYQKDATGFGATFNEASYSKENWGWSGAKVFDVILGNGNSCRTEGELVPAEQSGWLKTVFNPKLVQMMLAKATHGICILEGTADVTSNQYIFSREGGAPVYLVLEVENAKSVIPSKPESIEVKAEPDAATSERGALQVTLITGADVFALHLEIDGVPVERWQIPLPPEGGGKMSFILRDLPPEKEVKVEIASAGKEGPVSEYISVKAKTSSALKVPALPESPAFSKGGEPKTLGEALVWAVPEITKLSPVTGGVLLEKVPSDFRKKNAVWDGFDGSIRIAAARAEIFSFQLVFEGKVKDCRINVSSLIGSENSVISEKNVKLWLNWYVEGQAEYAIPLKGSFDCPSRDNAVEGQKLQAITVDCHIPKETKPGEYFGKVTVVAGGKSIILPLKIKVYDVVIPDDLNFNPELNAYNSVSKDFHKLAHYNRCTLNSLPYGQDGSVQSFIPKTKTGGHISDWSLYDETVGGVLDGSLFLDNPRSGVPAATFYLPFFEGWPLDYRKYFETAVEFANLKDSKSRLTFNLKAKPIKEAISTEYKESFKNCVREFYSHAKEKKWTRTIFQFYLNNKPSYNFSAWTLDEPKQYLDWAAINFWAELYKSAINDPEVYESKWQKDLFVNGMKAVQRERPVFLFRGDISRPQWQGELSDGLMNIMYANNVQFAFPRLMQVHKKRMPVILHTYGECNAVNRSNWESAAWCLQAYVNGCDGVLPWQSIGKQDALTKADNTGLLLFSKVHNASVASLRVHALRRGAQDVELLRLLQLKKGWNREQIAMLVGQKIKLRSDFKQLREDDATAAVFNELSGASFLELKESVMRLLTE